MAQGSEGDRLRQGGQFCSAINCQNARFKLTSKGKRFHKFPKDEERCKIWMHFTRRKDFDHLTPSDLYGKGYCLCSDHFEESQYNCPTQKKSLVWNAVPTVFSIPNPPCKVTSSRKRPMDRMSKPTSAKQPRISQKAVVLHVKQFFIPGSQRTEMMPTRSVVPPKSPLKKDLNKADPLLFCSDLHQQSEKSTSSKKPACNKVASSKKRKRKAADSEKVSAAESLLVLSSSSSVADRWVKEEKQDADSSARSKYAEETLADMTVEDGVGPNLPSLKEEPFDPEYQLNSQEPLSSVEHFNEIKPVFLSEVPLEAESHHAYCQQYEIKHDPEEFKIELNPDWHQDDQDSERDNPLPNMATELDSEDIKPIRKDYTVKSENASGGSVSHTAHMSAEVQKLLHDNSRQKICTKMLLIKAHDLEKVGKADGGISTASTAAITSVSNGQLHKSLKVIVVSAAGKVEHCLTITQLSVPALNPQTILTPNGEQQSSVRQSPKTVGGRKIIVLTPTGEKKSTFKDSGIFHNLKVHMSQPDTETTTSSKEKCAGQKILPLVENQQSIAEMPEQFSAGSGLLICKNCDARIEGQPSLVKHLMTCSTANGRLWPKSSVSQMSFSTTCSLDQKLTASKSTQVWVRPKDPALQKTDVPKSFKVGTRTQDRSKHSKEINVKDDIYRCEVCNSHFKEFQDFFTHMQIHGKHEINLCPRCGKQFSSPSAFDKHMPKHGSERPFACGQCPKTFKYMTGLKSHLHLHTDKKRFECEICSKQFSSSSNLKRHRLTHTRWTPQVS